ncbi:hypothetical protein GGX14DRAFT_663947 [Mycena pura]|uniref:Uncharacterized protein n=1 Tax=Mycena pura TaxID=153505 RepID=A0AAD6YL51_9AGAR|nr:hypothetical protein GGX14DRAFT_663947 [Mycena pura]
MFSCFALPNVSAALKLLSPASILLSHAFILLSPALVGRAQVQLSASFSPSRVSGIPTFTTLGQEKADVFTIGFFILGCVSISGLAGLYQWTRSRCRGRLHRQVPNSPPPPPPPPPPPSSHTPPPQNDDAGRPSGEGGHGHPDGGDDPQRDGSAEVEARNHGDAHQTAAAPAPEDPRPPLVVSNRTTTTTTGLAKSFMAGVKFLRRKWGQDVNPIRTSTFVESEPESGTIPGLLKKQTDIVNLVPSLVESRPQSTTIPGLLKKQMDVVKLVPSSVESRLQSTTIPGLLKKQFPVVKLDPSSFVSSASAGTLQWRLRSRRKLIFILVTLPGVGLITSVACVLWSYPSSTQAAETAEPSPPPALAPPPAPPPPPPPPPPAAPVDPAHARLVARLIMTIERRAAAKRVLRARTIEMVKQGTVTRREACVGENRGSADAEAKEHRRRVREVQRRIWGCLCELRLVDDEVGVVGGTLGDEDDDERQEAESA